MELDIWNHTFSAAVTLDDGNSLLVGFRYWKFLYKFAAKIYAQLYYNDTLVGIKRTQLKQTNGWKG
jgi:hypothetical protein